MKLLFGAALLAAFSIPLCGFGKSAKRGIAYDLAAAADLKALSPGVSWWYNWASTPNPGVPPDYRTKYKLDYYPMLWNGNRCVGHCRVPEGQP